MSHVDGGKVSKHALHISVGAVHYWSPLEGQGVREECRMTVETKKGKQVKAGPRMKLWKLKKEYSCIHFRGSLEECRNSKVNYSSKKVVVDRKQMKTELL